MLPGIVYNGDPAVVMSIELMEDKAKRMRELLGDGLLDDRDRMIKRGE